MQTGWLLDKFDPTALLTRKATTQAPSKAAQDDWDHINCAVLGLAKQFMVRHEAGGIKPNQFYDQLLMLHRVLPMLILQRDQGDSQDVFDKNVLSRCDLFLKGEWPRLYNAALRRNNKCNAQARRHASKHGNRLSENADLLVRQEAAMEQALLNNLGKAVNILTSSGLAAYAFPELCRHLQKLHPEEEVSTDGMGDPGSTRPPGTSSESRH